MKNLAKTYDPKSFEQRIYEEWEKDGDFIADNSSEKETYSIVMPPPNVTGNLHLGHAMNNTLQDILIRWKRMQGFETLWVPGTDHASISTEAKVVERLRSKGITKDEIGREGFLEEAWAWTKEYGGNINRQLRRLGVSCDWSRSRFTMDEGLSKAVVHVFATLYRDGYIYRGDRIVNWCPSCRTAISDAEVKHEDEHGSLWYIRYPVVGEETYVTLATTRPETMLGDLAVAVNPEDDRLKHLIGEKVLLPLMNREIPVVGDPYVDMEFGTGVVKITPSHDPNDYEVGERHNLGQKVMMDEKGYIADGFAPYSGMERYEARKAIVKDLEKGGYLDHIEEHDHAVGHCERCHTTIEPLLSKQWFVKMADLAKEARKVVEDGEVTLIPERFTKTYYHWLDTIRDWCISRQLWWGHRIPVWYCEDCGEIIVSEEDDVHTCPKCGSENLRRDEDTLDTWFSSALWPFSTMGWPEETADMEKFFPTDALVTGYDILFFWVIRMVFSALHHTGKIPFHHVYFTGLIRDEQGRKMSKSLNNGIDPLDVIEEYGADALRFTLVNGTTPGNDMRFSMDRVVANRNFANKLWNATRFVMMNLDDDEEPEFLEEFLELEDQWILARLNTLKALLDRNLTNYEFGLAAGALYEFIWFMFCDWYVEFAKPRLYGNDEKRRQTALGVLCRVLSETLRLLHPFMPFITEEIWQTLPFTKGRIIHAEYPKQEEARYKDQEEAIDIAIDAITAIRNERQVRNISPAKKSDLYFYSDDARIRSMLKEVAYEFKNLASAEEVHILDEDPTLENAAVAIREKLKIYIPLGGLIDYAEQLKKLQGEAQNVENEIRRAEGKLNNESFVQRAPEAVVEKERKKLETYTKMLSELEKSIAETERFL